MFFFCKRLLKRYIYMIIYRINPGFWQTTHSPLHRVGVNSNPNPNPNPDPNPNPREGWVSSLPETGIYLYFHT